ncbi:MAG: PLP-dependent aminotransferase family protein, partial [Bacillota bacterium]|nr:PLP-dependent aminotransferase family protein [Bacillota bacterium]
MLEIFKTITLDKNSHTPLYTQLYDSIHEMLSQGVLTQGFRLPSVRELSKLLGINQITVVSAYRLLENNGFAHSKTGSGTYIENLIGNGSQFSGHESISDELYQQEDISIINSRQIEVDENTINFASATPTTDLFPVDDFKTALNEVLERDRGNAFAYQESQGYEPLRYCIFDKIKSQINCGSPETIQVISGSQQGIDIISKALLKQGDCVITESPTYSGAIAVFKSRGADIADVEITENGPNLNILEYLLKKHKPRFIYSIPSFQNPTGYSYSNMHRKEMLALAEKYNTYIIEDDYVSDLDFEGKNLYSIKSLYKNDRVIFIKSFSKIFMPGLRLGFMVVPQSLQENVLEAKHTTDISTSGLIQRAFDLYIRKGFWNKHMSFMFDIYKERYYEITKALDENLPPQINYSKPGGGLNIWLNLPFGFPMNSLLRQTAAEGLVFAPGNIFYGANSPQKLNNIRLSYAAVHTQQINAGIKRFCEIAERMLQNNSS